MDGANLTEALILGPKDTDAYAFTETYLLRTGLVGGTDGFALSEGMLVSSKLADLDALRVTDDGYIARGKPVAIVGIPGSDDHIQGVPGSDDHILRVPGSTVPAL
jgi:hypothetical protein